VPANAAPVGDDKLTLIAISALACILQDVLHEGLGHGLTAWLSGARRVTMSQCRPAQPAQHDGQMDSRPGRSRADRAQHRVGCDRGYREPAVHIRARPRAHLVALIFTTVQVFRSTICLRTQFRTIMR